MNKSNNASNVPSRLLLYFEHLENGVAQKAFIREIRKRTGASRTAVKNWVMRGVIPASNADRKLIAEIMGFSELELWEGVEFPPRGGRNRKSDD